MYNVAIIDNDLDFLASFIRNLKQYNCYHISTYSNYDAFLKANHKIDILFITDEFKCNVDYHLIENYSKVNFLTVFIIKNDKKIYEISSHNIIWNIKESRLCEVISLINEKVEKCSRDFKMYRITKEQEFMNIIKNKNIRFIYKAGNDLCVFADKEYRIRYTIDDFINNFDISNFVRASYSVLIAPDFIKVIDFTKRIIVLKDGQEFTITRGYLYNVYEKCYGNEQFDCIGGKKIKIKK